MQDEDFSKTVSVSDQEDKVELGDEALQEIPQEEELQSDDSETSDETAKK